MLRPDRKSWTTQGRFLRRTLILFVANVLHPVDNFSIELFLNGDVCHGRSWRGSMPVLLAGRKPDHITRADFFHRPAPSLRAAAARRDDERLSKRMRVPCGARAGLEVHAWRLEQTPGRALETGHRSVLCR